MVNSWDINPFVQASNRDEDASEALERLQRGWRVANHRAVILKRLDSVGAKTSRYLLKLNGIFAVHKPPLPN